MRRVLLLLTALAVVGATAVVPGTVAAADTYADRCEDTTVRIGEDGVSETITSPNDRDFFLIELEKGHRVNIELRYPPDASSPELHYEDQSGDTSHDNVQNARYTRGDGFEPESTTNPMVVTFVGEESQTVLCVGVGSRSNTEDFAAFEWELELEKSTPDPEGLEPPEMTNAQLQNQIEVLDNQKAELQTKLQEKNETIQELEEQKSSGVSSEKVEQKDQRIEELESEIQNKEEQISELEAELESQSTPTPSQEVSIDVEVQTEGDQESFEVGEPVIFRAESSEADLSEMRVTYAGTSYEFNSAGVARVEPEASGRQQMEVVYGDTRESVVVDVRDSSVSSTATPAPDTATSVPETPTPEPDTATPEPGTPTPESETPTATADTGTNEPETERSATDERDSGGQSGETTRETSEQGDVVDQAERNVQTEMPGFGPVTGFVAVVLTLGLLRLRGR